MMDVRELPYFGSPTKGQAELLKAGKDLLNPGFYVQPKPVTPDTEGVAVAFEHPPYPYLDGYAYVANSDTPEKMRNALAAVYGIRYTEYVTTPAQWLSRVMGVEVKEVEVEHGQTELEFPAEP
jgi:hypothetical protein